MKILFIQQLRYEWLAPMIFSAIAKEREIETKLIIEADINKAATQALKEEPDAIIFASITTGNYYFVSQCANLIKKKKNIFIMAGGIHITMYYEKLDMKSIDIFGIGEGEVAFSGILDMLYFQKGVEQVPGIAYMNNGKMIVNPPRYIENLDMLPMPDYQLYYRYSFFRNEKIRMFYSGRGCRYNCKYCCVPYANNDKKAIRKRSPLSLVNEILYVDQKYGMKAAFFQDDTFLQDKEWLKEFLELYKKMVNKKFMCLSNAQELDKDTINILKESGCVSIGIGVECINSNIRRQVNRMDTDEQIMKALYYTKKAGIRITTFNMVGLPNQSLQDIIDTIDFYRYFKVDSVWCVLYQDFMNKEKSLWESKVGNFYTTYSGQIQNKEQIETIQKLMPYIVKYPKLLNKIENLWIKKLSYFLFAFDSYIREVTIWERSYWLSFRIGVYNQLCYKKNMKGID